MLLKQACDPSQQSWALGPSPPHGLEGLQCADCILHSLSTQRRCNPWKQGQQHWAHHMLSCSNALTMHVISQEPICLGGGPMVVTSGNASQLFAPAPVQRGACLASASHAPAESGKELPHERAVSVPCSHLMEAVTSNMCPETQPLAGPTCFAPSRAGAEPTIEPARNSCQQPGIDAGLASRLRQHSTAPTPRTKLPPLSVPQPHRDVQASPWPVPPRPCTEQGYAGVSGQHRPWAAPLVPAVPAPNVVRPLHGNVFPEGVAAPSQDPWLQGGWATEVASSSAMLMPQQQQNLLYTGMGLPQQWTGGAQTNACLQPPGPGAYAQPQATMPSLPQAGLQTFFSHEGLYAGAPLGMVAAGYGKAAPAYPAPARSMQQQPAGGPFNPSLTPWASWQGACHGIPHSTGGLGMAFPGQQGHPSMCI